jgi:beta-phosphoglucomutase-like phosphatase (HAD superfamily)
LASLTASVRAARGRDIGTRADFDLVAHRFPLVRLIDCVVTSDDTARFKPDPDPYLVALERLQVDPAAGVEIEDSPNGVRSADLAGILVIGLAGAFSASQLTTAGARVGVESLETLADLSGARLVALRNSARPSLVHSWR